MHADRHTSRGVYTMFWTLTKNGVFLVHRCREKCFVNTNVNFDTDIRMFK